MTLVLEAITLKPGRSSDLPSVMPWNRDQKAGGLSMDQVGLLCSVRWRLPWVKMSSSSGVRLPPPSLYTLFLALRKAN